MSESERAKDDAFRIGRSGVPIVLQRMGRPARFFRPSHRNRHCARRNRAAARDRNNWWVPVDFGAGVRRTHNITMDAAAGRRSSWVPENWFGPEHPDPVRRNALWWDWAQVAGEGEVWVCPPFLPPRTLAQFVQRAAQTAARGTGVVALLPDSRARHWYRRWITDNREVVVTETVVHQRVRFGGPRSSGKPARFDTVSVHREPRTPPLLSAWPVAAWPRKPSGVTTSLQGDPRLTYSPSQAMVELKLPRRRRDARGQRS